MLALLSLLGALRCTTSVTPSLPTPPAAQPEPQKRGGECNSAAQCRDLCARRQPRACLVLAHMLEVGRGAPQSNDKAGEAYAAACNLSVVEACTQLAMMHDVGLLQEPAKERALELYQRACRLKDSWACRRSRQLEGQ